MITQHSFLNICSLGHFASTDFTYNKCNLI